MPYKRAFTFRPTIVNEGNYTVDNDRGRETPIVYVYSDMIIKTINFKFCHHINITFARFPVCERIAVCDPYQL